MYIFDICRLQSWIQKWATTTLTEDMGKARRAR